MIRKHEQRKILTLWVDCAWQSPDTEYSANSLVRGYRRVNEEIIRLAQVITIQSVCCSQVVLPSPSTSSLVRLFATIVYSGDQNAQDLFGDVNPYSGDPIRPDTTVIDL